MTAIDKDVVAIGVAAMSVGHCFHLEGALEDRCILPSQVATRYLFYRLCDHQ